MPGFFYSSFLLLCSAVDNYILLCGSFSRLSFSHMSDPYSVPTIHFIVLLCDSLNINTIIILLHITGERYITILRRMSMIITLFIIQIYLFWYTVIVNFLYCFPYKKQWFYYSKSYLTVKRRRIDIQSLIQRRIKKLGGKRKKKSKKKKIKGNSKFK